MNRTPEKKLPLNLFAAALLLALGMCAGPTTNAFAGQQADNTKNEQGRRGKDATTADQQKMNPTRPRDYPKNSRGNHEG